MWSQYIDDVIIMKISFSQLPEKNFTLPSKLAWFVEFLWLFYCRVSQDSCSKLSLTKRLIWAKSTVNFQIAFSQFNCFLVCLAAYQVLSQKVQGGGGGGGESRVVNNHICVLNTVVNLVLCIEHCNQFSEKQPCCQIKPAFWTKMATVLKMSSSLNKTYLTKTISKILWDSAL